MQALGAAVPLRRILRQPRGLRLRLDRRFPGAVPEAARLRHLKPYLPALAPDLGREAAAIRHDWGRDADRTGRRTVHHADAAVGKGASDTLFRVQGYGMPPATLSSNALADLSEGEGAQWKRLSASRWASSASHLYGRPVTSSETWTWLHSPSFRATPLDMKAEADLHFLSGHQPADRARLALHRRRRRVPGMALLCRRRVQRQESLVDRDARPFAAICSA